MEDALLPLKPAKPPADSTPSAASSSEEVDWTGQVLGEFRLLHRLGRGGMGQVYLAEQTSLKRKVALKLLNPELAANERSLLRFKAEAENVARATHANIVQIYTIGQANGINYIALEYVEGKNLREFIEKKGTPEVALGLHIMSQVAAALQRATEHGIVHRDIKPENILLTKKGEVKVADFGLSRIMESDTQVSLTQSQVTMGTPLYMSPEQVERKSVDCRTDIYSFGVTCYHMFAGTPPFRGTSPIEVAYQHVHKDPQPLTEIRPDLPIELCAIVQKMMAKKPEDRFQTPQEVVREINRLSEALNLGAGALSISASFLGNSSDALRGGPSQTWPGAAPPTSPLLRALAVLSIFAALAGGLYFGWYRHHRFEPVNDPPQQLVPPEDIGLVKLPDLKERERELRQRVDEHLKPESRFGLNAGLKLCVDLGLFYLKHNRLDDANSFFTELGRTEQKIPAYRLLGRIGHASVLAFQDKPLESNTAFLELAKEFDKMEPRLKKKDASEEALAYADVWKSNSQVRELAAKALNRNYANQPEAFAEMGAFERLNVFRFPPRPALRAAPPTMP